MLAGTSGNLATWPLHDLDQSLATRDSLSSRLCQNKSFPSMPPLQWSDALVLDLPAMNDTHREFVDLQAVVESAGDDTLLAHWRTLVDHTDDHFGQEDRWMQDTRFPSTKCHSVQHKVVLQVMREGIALSEAGDPGAIRQVARELAI